MATSAAATDPSTAITQVAAQFLRPIQCAAWRRDGLQLALVGSGSSEIEVWSLLPGPAAAASPAPTPRDSGGGKPAQAQQPALPQWARSAVLKGHEQGQPVSALDWDHPDDLLVSCSHDRNAYIWRQDRPGASSQPAGWETGTRVLGAPGWSRQLVETSLKKGCLCVQWCPLNKNKLAVGSASKVVAVAFFDKELGWWSSLQLRAASGSATCLAWHPRSHLLAVGSTEGYVRLFHAGTDTDAPSPHAGAPRGKFGQLVCCVVPPSGGWLHALAWLPSGRQLLFATHACQLHACDLERMMQPAGDGGGEAAAAAAPAPSVSATPIQPTGTLHLPGCRIKSLLPLSDGLVVGGGWDGVVLVLACGGGAPALRGRTGHGVASAAREDDTARVADNSGGAGGSRVEAGHFKGGPSDSSKGGAWSLRYMLGRFMPGERPPMAPEFLANAAPPTTPPRSGDTALEDNVAGGGTGGNVAQRLRQLSLQREQALQGSPGLLSRAPSSLSSQPPALSPAPGASASLGSKGDNKAAAEAQAWRQVLAASRPAHDGCITALARPGLPWHSPFLAPGASATSKRAAGSAKSRLAPPSLCSATSGPASTQALGGAPSTAPSSSGAVTIDHKQHTAPSLAPSSMPSPGGGGCSSRGGGPSDVAWVAAQVDQAPAARGWGGGAAGASGGSTQPAQGAGAAAPGLGEEGGRAAVEFASCGLDGKMLLWRLPCPLL